MCDSLWCPLPAPLSHSKIDENSSPYLRQGMVVPVSSPSSSPAVVAEVPSRGGGSAKAVGSSCSSSGPGEQKIEPLIVFDWDDTILTSSWIQVNELLQAGSYDDLPVEAKRDLAHLERSVIECLKNARQLGTVIIITNAESGWVELSAARFFKDVLPLLEDVAVVSARSLFEAQFPGSPLCWKSAAFAYMMHDHFLDRPRWIQKKVVSIGDSNEEKVAMRIAAGQHATMAAKAVKFIAGPDPEALACQLDFVTQHLESVVVSDTDVDIVLDASIINGAYALPMHSRGVYGDPSPSAADAGRSADQSAATSPDVIGFATADVAPAHASPNSTVASSRSPPTAGALVAPAPTATAAATCTEANPAAAAAGEPSPTGSSKEMAIITTANTATSKVEEDVRASSNPIPIPIPTPILVPVLIPGQGAMGGRGAEGGGDCVQPLPPSPVEVGGCSFPRGSASTKNPAEVLSDDALDGSGGFCGGGARSEGDSACGGLTCPAGDENGVGGGSLVEIKLERGGVATVEDGELAVAAKVLDEAAGVEDGVMGRPLTITPSMATGDLAVNRGTAVREDGVVDDVDVVVDVVDGGQVVVKPAPMA